MEGEGKPMLPPEAAALIANDDARFIESTPAAQRLLQFSEEELLTKFVWDITPGARRDDARELWSRFLEAGQDSGMYQVRRADGRLVTCRYEAVARISPGRHLSV